MTRIDDRVNSRSHRRMKSLLICAVLMLPSSALAQPAPKPPPSSQVTLSAEEIITIQWMVQNTGEHCGTTDQAVIYCQAALQAHALWSDLIKQMNTPAPVQFDKDGRIVTGVAGSAPKK